MILESIMKTLLLWILTRADRIKENLSLNQYTISGPGNLIPSPKAVMDSLGRAVTAPKLYRQGKFMFSQVYPILFLFTIPPHNWKQLFGRESFLFKV